jgi:excisionase family DNA binding protein
MTFRHRLSGPTACVAVHMNPQERQVFTVEQFAENYGIGRTRVFGEIAAGRLKALKFGRNTRIARVDGDVWLEARRSEGGLPSRRAA